jgi:histidinol-phosphate aminotransferase
LIAVLQKTRQPFNVSAIGQVAALAALEDNAHQAKTKNVVDEGRAYLAKEFAAMGLNFLPSHGNFVMVDVKDGPAMFKELLNRNIIVRPLQGYQLNSWVRISVGTTEQNKQCVAAMKDVLTKGKVA